ncbi:hypothetical protein FOZ63_013953, partial [Perkinsus olseni]
QFEDDSSEVCKSTSTTPPVVVVKKGSTTAIYRFNLDCSDEVTVECLEAGDAVDVNTFMGFLTREVAVPEATQCRTKHGVNPLAATIEIDVHGTEGMRYLTWPKDYTTEEPEAEIPAPSTLTTPRRGQGFESSARVNYGGFRNSGGDRTATRASPSSAAPTSPIASKTTAQIPSQNRQRNLSRPRTTFKTSIRTPGFPHRDRGYHFKTSITHGAVDGREREADRSNDRVS